MKLGLVTYNLASDWDIDTLIERCRETGFTGVEPRTSHAHGIETSLTQQQREAVKQRFAEAGIDLVQIGTAYEYHSLDPDEVQKNIEGTKEAVLLAKDLGIAGVKVRPNGVQTDQGVPIEKTLEQIGKAAGQCAAFAADHGVEIRMEVHGRVTQHVPYIRAILDAGDHPNLKVTWNCNDGETDDTGSIKTNFDLLKNDIGLVHIQDIGVPRYPWQELFTLLKGIGYDDYFCAEIQPIDQPVRLMHYYKTVFDGLVRHA
ncbi:MAG: sugar phosphate isomerase/epimerase family protein [Phycisphaeraceae bacterium]